MAGIIGPATLGEGSIGEAKLALEVWDAEELAGCLLGLDDAKAELQRLFTLKQEGNQPEGYVDEITEAAERWMTLMDQAGDWLCKVESGDDGDS